MPLLWYYSPTVRNDTESVWIGICPTTIVGVRYYRGYATTGEHVTLNREPTNPYDRNAIRVDNVMGVQIGHIGRAVAAKLAKYMVGLAQDPPTSRSIPLFTRKTGPQKDYRRCCARRFNRELHLSN